MKTIQSVDISSYTIITTAIATLISIIVAVLSVISMAIIIPDSAGTLAYLIPTIVVGTLIFCVFIRFSEGFLYNTLVRKLNPISFEIKNGEITKISATETATIIAVITTIITILFYLAGCFIVPLLISSMITTFMYVGQTALAFSLYQIMMLVSQPYFIILTVASSFIVTFVFVLLGCYIYNILASNNKCVAVDLKSNGVLESINPMKLAIVFSIISLVLNAIIAIISLISGADILSALGTIIGGFISGFIYSFICAVFYNYLSDKLGKLKIELIDN